MAIETLGERGGDGVPRASERRQLRGAGVSPAVAQTLSREVGPGLLSGLVDLVGSGTAWTSRDWLEAVVVTREMIGFCQALQLTCVRELDRSMDPAHVSEAGERPGGLPLGRRAADELAPALGCAPSTASRLVGLARRLDALPAAADALADGRLDLTQVRALDAVTQQLPPPHVATLEALAVRLGPTRTSSQLRVQLETAAAGLDPVFVQRQVENGIEERDVRFGASPLPGCHRLTMDLPTLQALGAWHALNGAAAAATRRGGGAPETRSLPQLRADLAAGVLTGQASGDGVPSAAELLRHAEVHIVVGADTLRGCDEAPAHVPGRVRSTPAPPATWPAPPRGAAWSSTRSPAPCAIAADRPCRPCRRSGRTVTTHAGSRS